MEESANQIPQSSLFPLQPNNTQQANDDKTINNSSSWLASASFNVSLLPSITSKTLDLDKNSQFNIEDNNAQKVEENSAVHLEEDKLSYPILDSPGLEEDEIEDRETRRRRKRRKLDKKKDKERSSKVKLWAGSEIKLAKDYYFDTKGDRDNLAFGSLYRVDIARYRLHHLIGESTFLDNGSSYKSNQRITILNPEEDSLSLDDKSKVGRYWSAKSVSVEQRKDLKRLRVIPRRSPVFVHLEDFISLQQETLPDQRNDLESAEVSESGEDWDEFVMHRTKEFNQMTRDKPHDENLWIAFANFQDEIASGQRKRSVQLQALEKKISILEKALELNPDSEELMLFFLETCRKRDNVSVLNQRWEDALVKHSGSYKLWRGFLQFCKGEFSSFTVSKMRKMYGHALQALSAARNQLYRKVCESVKSKLPCKELVESEQALVDIFVSLCKFEWQAGHQELAIGLFQAEIEYSLFPPLLQLTETNKQRLFEFFWNSEGAKLGEDGALGWAVWLEREEEKRQTEKLLNANLIDTEPGGWTGWSEPPSKVSKEVTGEDHAFEEKPFTGDDNDDLDAEDSKKEDDMESLLEKLGLNLDPGKEVEVNDPLIWKRWADEEAKRDREQWMPVHAKSGNTICHDGEENEDDEQLLRVVLFEDIRDYLFGLHCNEVRFSLIVQLIDFCDGPISQWSCTNSSSWRGKIANLDSLSVPLFEEVQIVQHALAEKQITSSNIDLQRIFGSVDSFFKAKDRAKFLHNVLLLASKAFPQNRHLKEALLISKGYVTSEVNSRISQVTGSRTLAKKLLKDNRQDLLLCGAYASIEAAAGNIDLARKIFDMALLALDDLPVDCRSNAPILYLLYAEAELAHQYGVEVNGSNSSQQRAIHILSCLGTCGKYSTFSLAHHVSSTQLLKARRGFGEQLWHLRSMWAHGEITEQCTALVVSAALLEELTIGWEAAARVYKDAFSMALPERRQQSLELELLYVRYIQMLEKNKVLVRPSQSWDLILQGLSQYPWNSRIYVSLIEISTNSAFTCKLRRLFDEYCQSNPSTVLWIFALTFELGRQSSGPRIHRLFERALADSDTQQSVILWRCYLAYELHIACNGDAARRIFFRAIHACPWSKLLWLDGFKKLSNILTAKELSDLQEVMHDKELRLRTDIYEILLEEETKL
ncbi:uncharacterized protein LOC131064559 isoform X2 [Cryptomeria japonica]|uniref:uncharacterized protein LOC131064559 isoform X2 n=1 Tax=Cryptomeria japonica TaxID=3369 RepID=UPI0027DA5DA8|nr:uncharacterized protein LOC131064559 isoform X2 [Cryptomeria japonica]